MNYFEHNFENATEISTTNFDPYMGVSAKLISLLHVAAQMIMVDPLESSNLQLMMKAVIKMYIHLFV